MASSASWETPSALVPALEAVVPSAVPDQPVGIGHAAMGAAGLAVASNGRGRTSRLVLRHAVDVGQRQVSHFRRFSQCWATARVPPGPGYGRIWARHRNRRRQARRSCGRAACGKCGRSAWGEDLETMTATLHPAFRAGMSGAESAYISGHEDRLAHPGVFASRAAIGGKKSVKGQSSSPMTITTFLSASMLFAHEPN